MNQMIKKAILPVAGLGTRFLPASKSIPKEIPNLLEATGPNKCLYFIITPYKFN